MGSLKARACWNRHVQYSLHAASSSPLSLNSRSAELVWLGKRHGGNGRRATANDDMQRGPHKIRLQPDRRSRQNGIDLLFDSAQARFSLIRGTTTVFRFQLDDYSSNTEALWSPDGQAFAINYSDGGAVGGFTCGYF
jgi:hypothetical protein